MWDLIVSIGATVAALLVPLELIPGFSRPFLTGLVEPVVTVLFAADVVVRVVRLDRRHPGHTPEAQSRIYAWSGIFLDVVAALPVHLLFGPSLWQLLRLFKLFRVAQLMHAWRQKRVQRSNILRLAFFAYWLLLSVHGITCGWISLRDAAVAVDAGTRYLQALYWCVSTMTTVGYGDVTPVGNTQTLYAIGVMILGVGVYGYVIGNVASILGNIDPARAAYLGRMERLSAFMHYRRLPKALQARIREYYGYLWEKRMVYDESGILHDLPASLRTEVTLFLKRDFIESVPLFQGAGDAFIRDVAVELKPVVFMPGDTIIRAGEQGREMFFISRGTVEIRAPGSDKVYDTLTEGDFFGEIALVLGLHRTADAYAVGFCDLYRLDKPMFDRILAHFPDVGAQIQKRAQERQRRDQT